MTIISITDLKPGMVLAQAVTSPQGRLLLHADTSLEPRHLTICKIWGVLEADVRNVDAEDVEALALQKLEKTAPEAVLRARRLMDKRFALARDSSPVMRELERQAVIQAARSASAVAFPCAWPLTPPANEAPPSPQTLIARVGDLATLPDICRRILEAVNNPRSSAAFVADIISKDVGLAAKLLKLANSSFYRRESKVDTLTRAVAMVGSSQIANLTLGVSLIHMFKDIPPQFLNMRLFWRHSLHCAVWSQLLAGHLRLPCEERCFLAGMLHDVGRLALLRHLPERYGEVLRRSGPETAPAHCVEERLLGYDHARLGGLLLEKWRIPEALAMSVHGHHAPGAHGLQTECCLVHLADIIAHALQQETGGPLDLVPPLDAAAWEALDANKNAIPALVPQANHQLREILRIFFNDHDQAK